MNYDQASVELVRQALIITLKIAAPVLAAGMLIGLVISVLQSVTSIQDQTIATVPKIVVMVVVAVVLASWIAQRLIEYCIALFNLSAPYTHSG
ncbi:MAG: flagellar biosynthetic protein FliQ [Phycisphaerales bacterium]|nr:flagellar biosynthetic protein FliQ [Phycisphaerales bacterium]